MATSILNTLVAKKAKPALSEILRKATTTNGYISKLAIKLKAWIFRNKDCSNGKGQKELSRKCNPKTIKATRISWSKNLKKSGIIAEMGNFFNNKIECAKNSD